MQACQMTREEETLHSLLFIWLACGEMDGEKKSLKDRREGVCVSPGSRLDSYGMDMSS